MPLSPFKPSSQRDGDIARLRRELVSHFDLVRKTVDAVETTASVASSSAASRLGKYVVVTDGPYLAKGDGVADDSASIAKALDAAQEDDKILLFPPGTYLAADVEVDAATKIEAYGATFKIATSATYYFDVQASFELRGGTFDGQSDDSSHGIGFNNSSSVVASVHVADVLFSDMGSGITEDAVGNGVRDVRIVNCTWDTVRRAVNLRSDVTQRVIVQAPIVKTTHETAIQLGNNDASAQDTMRSFIVADGIFDDIGSTSASYANERHAIICYGEDVSIVNNSIREVDNNTKSDCEGIYVKARQCVIAFNRLRNAGYSQGCIAVKGDTEGGTEVEAFGVTIIGNTVFSDRTGDTVHGIFVRHGQRTVIADNYVNGPNRFGISVGGPTTDESNLRICNNVVVNCGIDGTVTGARVGISMTLQGGAVVVDGNTIDNVDGAGDSNGAIGVDILANNDIGPVIVSDNVITNMVDSAGSEWGMRFRNAGTSEVFELIHIRDNLVDTADEAIRWDANTSNAFPRVLLLDNDFTNITNAPFSSNNGPPRSQVVARFNHGYWTENQGTDTVTNGSTSVTVTHGLDYTPSTEEIQVCPTETLGAASYWYVDTITSTQFNINVDVDPTKDVTFGWSVGPDRKQL